MNTLIKSNGRKPRKLHIPPLFAFLFAGLLSCGLLNCGSAFGQDGEMKRAEALFSQHAAPILTKHCANCHSGAKPKSKLDLTSLGQALKGAASGPVVEPGKSGKSLLLQLVQADGEPHMPPKGQLSPEEISVLSKWIDGLSPSLVPSGERPISESDRQHWSFQPVTSPQPPVVRQTSWIQTGIDPFILSKLEQAGLQPAVPAEKVDLIRRVTFDLTGLPPSQDEVKAFLADRSTQAYEKVVDRLLASPHYGERWGRHWLDLARYADSDGFEYDNDRPYAYRYRDYVIRSFNTDKPYDQFIREQLAGDEISLADADCVIATGFCRHGPTVENQSDEKTRVDEIDDIVSTTSSVFLGLTVGCARCHDHKFDPIRQQDYYRLFAIFNSREKQNVPVGSPAERAAYFTETAAWEVETERLEKELTSADNSARQVLERQLLELKQRPPQQPLGMAIQDSGRIPRKTHLLLRGDHRTPGPEIEPGVPVVLTQEPLRFPSSTVRQNSTGQRSVLAHWIAHRDNPLTARVWVNRVWQYHFGQGLVATPSNFGLNGVPPTRPELLDWLAGKLIDHDWKLKPLHRQIVLSATYRQSTTFNQHHASVDSGNALWWRFPPRRLSGEEIRDSILAASGTLNRQSFGPGIRPRIDPNFIATSSTAKWPVIDKEGPELWRRSIYIFTKRSVLVPLLEAFDAPTAQQSCERRLTTTVATQALQLLNDPFTDEQAALMALRIENSAGPDRKAQVQEVYWNGLSRAPTSQEIDRGIAFLKQQFDFHHQIPDRDPEVSRRLALTDLCHVLFNLNEFIYLN